MSLGIGRSFEEKHRMIYTPPPVVLNMQCICSPSFLFSIYLIHHMHTSLRAALSQVFSFELAEEGVNSDWVSKPITCISYAAPRSGTSGYWTAVKARMT
jgi:hypothetical protein